MNLQKINNLAISPTGFIFDPNSGNSYNSNEIGLIILDQIKQSKEIHQISGLIADQYDVSQDQAEDDINQFLEDLTKNHLI